MNIRKHLAGFILFSLILGSIIFINYFLTLPEATIPPVQTRQLLVEAMENTRLTYKVQQVSLDFASERGYTSLRIKLRSGQPAPESIWVTTHYFSPEIYGSGWSSTTEIRHPFAAGDEFDFVAMAPWERGTSPKIPGVSYFAHVNVSSWQSDVKVRRDMTTAMPVVVHWPDEARPSANTLEKFSR